MDNPITVVISGHGAELDEEKQRRLIENPQELEEYKNKLIEHIASLQTLEVRQTPSKEESAFNSLSSDMEQERKILWTSSLVKLLVHERLKAEKAFRKPTCKKKILWAKIAKIVSRLGGCYIDANTCDTKYRSMLSTYRNNKKKQLMYGEDGITWDFFKMFDEVLGSNKASLAPQNENIMDSLYETSHTVEVPYGSDDEMELKTESSRQTGPLKKRRTTAISNYLEKKLKLDKEYKEKKLQMQNEQISMRREMKEKEIDAIIELAHALGRK